MTLAFVSIISGIALIWISAEKLEKYSVLSAKQFGMSPFLIGSTVIAFGTSAPELAISVHSALKGYEGITLGNIVGSNIANVLFALPLAFLIKIPLIL